MAATQEKATPFCHADESHAVGAKGGGAVSRPVRRKWASEPDREKRAAVPPMEVVASLIAPVEDIQETPSVPTSSKAGIPVMMRAQTRHPLDPLSAAEISVAVATVRAAGATPEVRDSMRFIEVVLLEPEKNIVALADAYYFPPFQPSLLPRTKGSPVIPSKLPPRRARLVVYNKKSNETSIWIVELSEVHAATRGGHHRGKVISSEVVPDVQPPMGLAGACRD